MRCPEHLVLKSRFIWIWMYWHDVPRSTIPLRVWMNPLNYEINIHVRGGSVTSLTINKNGNWIRDRIWGWRNR